ncbi:MAG TPA: heavy-metal-associated domain-containing protein [Steroidobacteraceae bacterium]|nr:heavy-metal-associated domain-containing protein [Steroidobacteraceae bacterium]
MNDNRQPLSGETSMEQHFEINGMHCAGCVNRVTKALKPLANEVSVTLQPPRATLDVDAPLALDAVRAAVATAGAFEVRSLDPGA